MSQTVYLMIQHHSAGPIVVEWSGLVQHQVVHSSGLSFGVVHSLWSLASHISMVCIDLNDHIFFSPLISMFAGVVQNFVSGRCFLFFFSLVYPISGSTILIDLPHDE